MLEYIKFINLDKNLEKRVLLLAEQKSSKILSLAERFAGGKYKCLVNQNDLTRLAVVIEALKYTKEKYERIGIDDKIFFDTIKDISIWCENNSNKGLKNYNWIKHHISAKLFKIGRMQYQFYTCDKFSLDYERLPFNRGESVIYIHIPQGEKLNYDDCVNSIVQAKSFFCSFFPEYTFRYFFCESWLLYSSNKLFIKPESNISRFSELFNIAYSLDIDVQGTERIFGKRRLIKSKYPENTSLQKAAKQYILNGGKLGIGIGYIDSANLKGS